MINITLMLMLLFQLIVHDALILILLDYMPEDRVFSGEDWRFPFTWDKEIGDSGSAISVNGQETQYIDRHRLGFFCRISGQRKLDAHVRSSGAT
jgi:hypothetical protein